MNIETVKEITISVIEKGLINKQGTTEEMAKEIALFINTLIEETK